MTKEEAQKCKKKSKTKNTNYARKGNVRLIQYQRAKPLDITNEY